MEVLRNNFVNIFTSTSEFYREGTGIDDFVEIEKDRVYIVENISSLRIRTPECQGIVLISGDCTGFDNDSEYPYFKFANQ